jgi:DNA invertase Pin-like site-specific DNA recombinase
VIDEDLGKSGTTAEDRSGFQRLVAEVSLNHVGMVLGVEMSRLARSCRDWYQLLEVCGLFDTLIGDLDGVYDPTHYNDRLLLGLKGTMSEAELHVLKQRMLRYRSMVGKQAKAQRGELGMPVPMGYGRRPSGEVIKDPDEQVQATIALVFDQFERQGTLNGVLQFLVRHHLQLPHRVRGGPRKGELEWHRPNRVTLSNLLHHPMYAGAYVTRSSAHRSRRQQPGRPARADVAQPRSAQCLKGRRPPTSPGRSSSAVFGNWKPTALRARSGRHGPSLLAGLVICGRS